MADLRTRQLAKWLVQQTGKPAIDQLYDCLRTAVYGLPGRGAVKAEDLVHELAYLLDKHPPDSDKSD